jgi:hypothetical protein
MGLGAEGYMDISGVGENAWVGVSCAGACVTRTGFGLQATKCMFSAKIAIQEMANFFIVTLLYLSKEKGLLVSAPNGLRYLRVGGRGFCSGAGKT